MGQVQLGRDLTDAQVNDIVAFLRSLTGTLPEHARMPGAVPTTPTDPAGATAPAEGAAPAPTPTPTETAPAAQ
jgi:hypothetical protein